MCIIRIQTESLPISLPIYFIYQLECNDFPEFLPLGGSSLMTRK